MEMGNSKSKKQQKEPERFFEREKWKHKQKKENKKEKKLRKDNEIKSVNLPLPVPRPAPIISRSYDEEAVERMRYQLNNDSHAFLLNNLLLSVQFFENYERQIGFLKANPVPEWDNEISNNLVNHNKHVFFADKIHEMVHENVRFSNGSENADLLTEPIATQRMFVIYDNIEANEPGDNTDYSSVLDAPVYKMLIDNCKEAGFVKLKRIEVLEGVKKEGFEARASDIKSNYTESGKESSDDESDDFSDGEELLEKLRIKLESTSQEVLKPFKPFALRELDVDWKASSRKLSGPIKQQSILVQNSNIKNFPDIKSNIKSLNDISEPGKSNPIRSNRTKRAATRDIQMKDVANKATISVSDRRPSGPFKKTSPLSTTHTSHEVFFEEDETSGYLSNSSPQNDSSGTDSDYGYATINELTTPKLLTKSKFNNVDDTAVLPDDCWIAFQQKSEEWNEKYDNGDEHESQKNIKKLYDTYYYLKSPRFMTTFTDNFLTVLGKPLGFSTESIAEATTQGASIYCDTIKLGSPTSFEIIPAIIIPWPSAAYEWIIRERRIIKNPKTNFSYQWPTKYVVNKSRGLGAILVPVGFRPKKGGNPDQELQWKIVFPAVERYLQTCLAHSQVRCYMFTLLLVKSFLENETAKIGIDANHIRNHLFWECEDNYARWPEDRLGETLRIFLRSLYKHFSKATFPDYFIENCNVFKNIPKKVLLKLQRRLADILESPVMHVLWALHHTKYIKRNFYPALDYLRLYKILTTNNALQLLNPNLVETHSDDSGNESDNEYKERDISFWDKAKSKDKNYQFKKEKQRQAEFRKKTAMAKKEKEKKVQNQEIDRTILLPLRMDVERRRLVLEFFIPHFIAMAQHSEKFGALKQAIIYLEQAQRLAILLSSEPAAEQNAEEFSSTIRVKLNEYKIKLADSFVDLPKRKQSIKIHNFERTNLSNSGIPRHHYANLQVEESPPPLSPGTESKLIFVDVHKPSTSKQNNSILRLPEDFNREESKL